MRRLRIYLDSSVWARLGDDTNSDRRKWTIRFLNRVERRHELLISPLVRSELADIGDPKKRAQVTEEVNKRHPLTLAPTTEAEELARRFHTLGGFGKRRLADLIHAGYAVLAGAGIIVTWDCRTFAHVSIRNMLDRWGRHQDREVPLIGTPTEVLKWLNLRMIWTGNSGKSGAR